ncbi:DUF4450 domain-containing protein [Mangrovibacterium lignilyticum]|uniref:DUF4450 domain-containing protein n=1 Tax=Mangrovibacterium lignilyticum TaxID=2668052 RepID=UPI0013D1C485|nr:DUF4450 domain-containing protein [Mangrovibacterium lignilyticum]
MRHWSEQERKMRYTPEHGDFVIVNGEKRFNRALYGSNTGFRVEAGDLPEFSLYMPRLGGTLRLGLQTSTSSKWLIECDHIEARYNSGSMRYKIKDELLASEELNLKLLALPDADGMILQMEGEDLPGDLKLFWAFGGASDKRFSREGDLGADPESVFYLTADKCATNEYVLNENNFDLYYGAERSQSDNEVYENDYTPTPEELEASRLKSKKKISGVFPEGCRLRLSDAAHQESPNDFFNSDADDAPAVCGQLDLKDKQTEYLLLLNPETKETPNYEELPELFANAEEARLELANHFRMNTPDEYLNAAGAALAAAADGVWDGKAFMHGAVAWRMPLNGWRGAYAADWLGWSERAETHFRGYFKAQYTEPADRPSSADPKTHLARQKEEAGTELFSDGYISRNPGKINKPHHYDMNLVFISQLLWHYRWTGDTAFIRESWPVLERHLAWEKRNFDANDDGLYDAYCCIWASDALQYSGGGVTHSSAYNYRANQMAAELAPIVGKDPAPYLAEAEKIKSAVNAQLWLPEKGWFAEYKDLIGLQQVHPSAAVWTIYHAIDEGLADPFQAWQSTEYVDHEIPRIPIQGEGVPEGFYTISTTNWMPYTWSINNVALAEVLHTALAYWKSGRSKEAFQLTKGSVLDYMFMGSSPGNYGQLSYYDTFRGELYRDFADPIGVASRVFVEGLFGFEPNLMQNEISLKPGWPSEWQFAEMETPYLKVDFKRNGTIDRYTIENHFSKELRLNLALTARSSEIRSIKVNGMETEWGCDENAIGKPVILVKTDKATKYKITVEWGEEKIKKLWTDSVYADGSTITLQSKQADILAVKDPQAVLKNIQQKSKELKAQLTGEHGERTFFVLLKQDKISWWQPIAFNLQPAIKFEYAKNQPEGKIEFSVRNNSPKAISGILGVNDFTKKITIPAKSKSVLISVSKGHLTAGSNPIEFQTNKQRFTDVIINWHIAEKGHFETVAMTDYFNDRITNIFTEQYTSPRSPHPTLSLPIQGIGDWCSYKEHEEIDDSGLRKVAGNGQVESPQGIPFATPSTETNNIIFTSQWDVYPENAELALSGKASRAYLLMAGSVHHMRINLVNGLIEVNYTDGSSDVLELRSPENWWPIEQDYYEDGFAFNVNAPRPPRLLLKTGEWRMETYPLLSKNQTIKIEGGAASLLDLPLNPKKELKSLQLRTLSNDLVIGLMAVTLKRDE